MYSEGFIVQLRSLEDHLPLLGITVGDIGTKFGNGGYNTMDNGVLRFDHVRIPRNQMLMRYVKKLRNTPLNLFLLRFDNMHLLFKVIPSAISTIVVAQACADNKIIDFLFKLNLDLWLLEYLLENHLLLCSS